MKITVPQLEVQENKQLPQPEKHKNKLQDNQEFLLIFKIILFLVTLSDIACRHHGNPRHWWGWGEHQRKRERR